MQTGNRRIEFKEQDEGIRTRKRRNKCKLGTG
jgi:hypothetical protein